MKLLISVSDDINDFINYAFNNNIAISDIKYKNNNIICCINEVDLNRISRCFNVKVINDYTYKYMIILFKNNLVNILLVMLAIFFFYIITNTIVDISIESNNVELVKKINNSLDNYGIRRISLAKNYIELKDIKNKVLNEYKEYLEWIEIEKIGMTYKINFEQRINKKENKVDGLCDVIADSDGIVSKIKSSSGVILVKVNQSVKKGDLLISGDIKLNDIDKTSICANGDVYANKWYSLSIELPKKYVKKEYSNKFRYNLLIENNNKDYKIFRSRFKLYDTDKSEIISLFGKKLYLLKEYEYKNREYIYEDDTLENRIDELIKEKLELNLSKNERIVSKKVLKKDENDSRIIIELFIIIEKLIGKQIIK